MVRGQITVAGGASYKLHYAMHKSQPNPHTVVHTATAEEIAALPDTLATDIGPGVPILDQGSCGRCTGGMAANVYMLIRAELGLPYEVPSMDFPYFNTAVQVEGKRWDEDQGAAIGDTFSAMARWGMATEKEWASPKNCLNVTPPPSVYAAAEKRKLLLQLEVPIAGIDGRPSPDLVLSMLNQRKPVGLGFAVYENAESEEARRTGRIYLPEQGEKLLGFHAVTAINYSRSQRWLKCRTPWTEDFGVDGCFLIPLDYIDGVLADDFHSGRAVSQ